MTDDLRSFDRPRDFASQENILAYLNAAMRSNDPTIIASAIGEVARAQGMATLALSAGLSRNSLYKSLCAKGNPSLSTLTKIVKALGLKLSVTPDCD